MTPDPADPPVPVPPHLRPLVAQSLGPGDLRVVVSTEELRTIARLCDHEGLSGSMILTHRDGSPWLEIAVAATHRNRGAQAPDAGSVTPL